ncbi:C6 zinc finger protein [Thozetella sp. PMI_491]|nr:C6 zinc finger protein [Thozetella sp. PMI_491]
MAMKNDNLLNLLLAYSAAHRARYLGHPGPRLRIMTFVKDILPYLLHLVKQVVDDPQTVISTADLATAIMMASLEIVSPASLGHSIPWQSHLRLAREIIVHRPGGLRRKHSDDQEDQACAFLWSWFAYLDVLGSLSGGRGQLGPHSSWVFGSGEGESDQNSEDDNQIDCIMGFTPRCVYILAKVAELARTCDALRIDPATNTVRPGWRPDPATAAEAIELREAAERSLSEPARPCRHVHATTNVVKWDRDQMAATNEAYHWAALIHLHRRVLGLPSDHDDVRVPVGKILSCLDRIERGGTAETCLLFPMFTAGCELTNDTARAAILERVRTVEKTGMTQVSGARKLMEKVWREGQPWETLLSTEFIG